MPYLLTVMLYYSYYNCGDILKPAHCHFVSGFNTDSGFCVRMFPLKTRQCGRH